ncbi:MAG: polymerase sigma factor [Verrucomicrobia bacterium]|jgi:RNA polymerase sigma-70 factor (ECF subfamily)|nr:polymerase sigma factor [Verrucomicrobiota bacterium]
MADLNQPVPTTEPSERFITLLNATHGRLLGFLRVMLGNSADAEDVLQRASLTMWRKFGEFDQTLDFFAWASSFAFYEAKNFQRVAARSKLHFDDELMARLAEERMVDLELKDARFEAMERCVEELDATSRDLVREFYLNDMQVEALAQRSGRAPQTLYNKLSILRRLLSECVRRKLAQEAGA